MSKGLNKTVNKRILIVSDSSDELSDIQHLLAVDFGTCLKTDREPEGLQLFHAHHPSVLILAFREIEKAEHFYLSLYRRSDQIHEIPHQTLLLCKNRESSKAYQLCKSGTFDDFVADRPLYDPYRLRLSVAQAINRCDQAQNSDLLNRKFEKISVGLLKFDQIINMKLASGGGQHQETTRTFQRFTQNLTADLKELEKNLIGMVSGKATQIVSKDGLGQKFDQFHKNSLLGASQHVIDQLNKTEEWLEEISSSHKDYVETAQQESEVHQEMKVMLVDDDEFYRDTITTMLQQAGMQVIALKDGKTALTTLQHSQPNLILLDYQMPDMDGIETLKRIKSNPGTKSIPVIMLTGFSEREIVDQSLRAGAADFIVKPGDRITILSKIDETLKT